MGKLFPPCALRGLQSRSAARQSGPTPDGQSETEKSSQHLQAGRRHCRSTKENHHDRHRQQSEKGHRASSNRFRGKGNRWPETGRPVNQNQTASYHDGPSRLERRPHHKDKRSESHRVKEPDKNTRYQIVGQGNADGEHQSRRNLKAKQEGVLNPSENRGE